MGESQVGQRCDRVVRGNDTARGESRRLRTVRRARWATTKCRPAPARSPRPGLSGQTRRRAPGPRLSAIRLASPDRLTAQPRPSDGQARRGPHGHCLRPVLLFSQPSSAARRPADGSNPLLRIKPPTASGWAGARRSSRGGTRSSVRTTSPAHVHGWRVRGSPPRTLISTCSTPPRSRAAVAPPANLGPSSSHDPIAIPRTTTFTWQTSDSLRHLARTPLTRRGFMNVRWRSSWPPP